MKTEHLRLKTVECLRQPSVSKYSAQRDFSLLPLFKDLFS